jgi:antitoxin component YwqK of YwqJK toxin-antitoxin module
MKHTLLIITALMLVVGCGSSEKEPEKEPINYETTLVEKDGVFYTKDTNKPYSGKVFSLYEVGGQKKSEGTFKDGDSTGVWTEWYENGQKSQEDTYKDGRRITKKCWDWNGNELEWE